MYAALKGWCLVLRWRRNTENWLAELCQCASCTRAFYPSAWKVSFVTLIVHLQLIRHRDDSRVQSAKLLPCACTQAGACMSVLRQNHSLHVGPASAHDVMQSLWTALPYDH
eukprot:scaffold23445_cov19-Tisochrysis_lutea.AAC.1